MTNQFCTCEPTSFPFECPRHCKRKSERHYQLCNLEADTSDRGLKYWNAWEQQKDQTQKCGPEEPVLDLVIKPQDRIVSAPKRVKSTAFRQRRSRLHWANAFHAECENLGIKIHEEPCNCGAAAKIKIHECHHPDIKRCVTTDYDLQKIKDIDVRNHLTSCERCPHRNNSCRFVTTTEFDTAIKTLISKLPSGITEVAGVARSGLYPASVIAMYLHLPLSALNQKTGEIQALGSGWRLKQNGEATQGIILIVDDTMMTGNSLTEVKRTLQTKQQCVYATVFVNPLASFVPDVWGEPLVWPHLLEWNLFNSVISPSVATDFDGILCRDCRPEEDDDGEKYLNFINTAEPTNLRPRKVPIPLIVTARIEKYRAATEAWLARHQIQFQKLIMHPAATLTERNRDHIPAYKAQHFSEWARRHRAAPGPTLFIESDRHQAQAIAKISGSHVLCPAAGKVF